MPHKTAVFALLFLYFTTLVQSHYISCDTSNGERGVCISLFDCPLVIDIVLKYSNNIPPIVKNELGEMTNCHAKKGTIFPLCCPISSVYKEKSNKPDTKDQKSQEISYRDSQLKTFRGRRIKPEITQQPPLDLSFVDPQGMEVLRSFPNCGDLEDYRKRKHSVSHGTKADIEEVPWMALLKYEIEGRPFLCGGSLITDRFVLTAAHCVKSYATLIGVRLGEHNLAKARDCEYLGGGRIECQPPFEEFGIEDMRVHPNYEKGAIGYDIAILKLDRSVTFKRHIRPICLPLNYTEEYLGPGKSFFIAGWGKTEDDTPSSVLFKAELQQQPLDTCRNYYEDALVTENHICAMGKSRQESCVGDSGGPLYFPYRQGIILRHIQVGVISFGGKGCGINEDQPGVFASIIDMFPWITQNLY